MKNLICFIFLFFVICILKINAATHIVTSPEDSGSGSLREIVFNAENGDTIIFAPDVDVVYLTTIQITINKNLTIIGKDKDNKTAISGNYEFVTSRTRIFEVQNSVTFSIENLIIENGKTDARSGGIDIGGYCSLAAKNCVFRNNSGYDGGGVFVL
jgi:hypothetical protein